MRGLLSRPRRSLRRFLDPSIHPARGPETNRLLRPHAPSSGRVDLVSLHDRAFIERVLRRDPRLHLYELGDLDDAYFRHTLWWGLEEGGDVRAIALLYTAPELPILVAHGRPNDAAVLALVRLVGRLLPRRVYAHLAPGIASALGGSFRVESHGAHARMMLTDRSQLASVDSARAFPLSAADGAELERFYAMAYPGHWFERRMLELGPYWAVREGGAIASVAGVHVYSPLQRVAALGNVATLAAYRGKGLARIACVAVCRALLGSTDHIGLNVARTNGAARKMYEDLGFHEVASYDEVVLEAR
jgi:ribosomal protein S18 acetylase RimI-like enzyme